MVLFKRHLAERTAGCERRDSNRFAAERLDIRLLQQGAVALYHKCAKLEEDAGWLRQAGYRLYGLDAGTWRTPGDFHAEARRVLAFPSHYASNLAAWIDCLGDLEISQDGGVVLQIRHYDAFARVDSQFAQTLLDSIESTSRRFLVTGRRLLGLVQSDDPRIRFERVGAMPVAWNPGEWLDADRGLRSTG
jgi:hypothetical protein